MPRGRSQRAHEADLVSLLFYPVPSPQHHSQAFGVFALLPFASGHVTSSEKDERIGAGGGWAGDRGRGEGDPAAVHGGVQAEYRTGGRRVQDVGRGRGVAARVVLLHLTTWRAARKRGELVGRRRSAAPCNGWPIPATSGSPSWGVSARAGSSAPSGLRRWSNCKNKWRRCWEHRSPPSPRDGDDIDRREFRHLCRHHRRSRRSSLLPLAPSPSAVGERCAVGGQDRLMSRRAEALRRVIGVQATARPQVAKGRRRRVRALEKRPAESLQREKATGEILQEKDRALTGAREQQTATSVPTTQPLDSRLEA